jgi:hypothetical protein
MSLYQALRQYLFSLGLPSNAAFFVPMFGLGDRLRFFSYLKFFDLCSGSTSYVVTVEGENDDLLSFYPDLLKDRVIRVPSQMIPAPREVSYATLGDDSPGVGRVYFTWHWHYRGGVGRIWESLALPGFTHDLAVKQILGIPHFFRSSPIVHPVGFLGPKNMEQTVFIAPFSRSAKGLTEDFWLGLISKLQEIGLSVISNIRKSGINPIDSQNYARIGGACDSIDCNLPELVSQVSRSLGIVAVRSGICDLFSLSSVPIISIFPEGCGKFWALPRENGNVYEADFIEQSPELLQLRICKTFRELALSRGQSG